MINPNIFILLVSFIVVSIKASSYLEPFNLYYSFSTIFIDSKSDAYGWALLIKIAIPFLVGLIVLSGIFILSRKISPSTLGRKMKISCEKDGAVTAYYSGFFGAFLLAWPMILYWDILASVEIWPHKRLMMIIYIFYIFSYGFMCSAGSRLALWLAARKDNKAGEATFGLVRDSFIGAASAGLATLLLAKLG